MSVIKNTKNCFDLREKNLTFWDIIPFCYLKPNTKQNMEKESKY